MKAIHLRVAENHEGQRLDRFLTSQLPDRSRTEISRWIRSGAVTLKGEPVRGSHRLQRGEEYVVSPPPPSPSGLQPEELAVEVIHEDDDLIVVNKPPGMPAHPGAGVSSGTLVNALLWRGPEWSTIGGEFRPGIVHRLDRDTSGVMVAARNDVTHRHLATQFKDRLVEKRYLALVLGSPRNSRGLIDAPIGRHRTSRTRMAVRDDGRAAQTRFRVRETLGPVSLLELAPLTGRTHQIRVHLSALGHPIAGDRHYGGMGRLRQLREGPAREALLGFSRLALHACRLRFQHPRSNRMVIFEAQPPADLTALLDSLRELAP